MVQKLEGLFASLHQVLRYEHSASLLSIYLPHFYQQLAETGFRRDYVQKHKTSRPVDGQRLRDWLRELEPTMVSATEAGLFCNVWQIAGVGRNELKNSRILAWLLSPKGTHGLGDIFLKSFLRLISPSSVHQIKIASSRWRVSTEELLHDDQSSRVDILVTSDTHYIVIEIKIDAAENPTQLTRYAEAAQQCAQSREWSLVYLTPGAQSPRYASKWAPKIWSISWRQLAAAIDSALDRKVKAHGSRDDIYRIPEHLIRTFTMHIRSL